MIEKIIYDTNTYAFVFTEPIPEYRELMLIAASDNSHKLHGNYKKDILADQLFMVLIMFKNDPVFMFGMQQEPWMGTAARGFCRAYKRPEYRTLEYSGIGAPLHGSRIMSFYNDHPKYHESFGVDTVFFTRNYTNEPDGRLLSRQMREWKQPYVLYKDVLMYRGVPQRFYVWGNDNFLNQLPVYS